MDHNEQQDKPEMFSNFNRDWEIWDKSKSESFLYITEKSCPFQSWYSYDRVKINPKYNNSILKPINNYAMHLYPPPKLISIDNNKITLRQGNHAEMFLLIKDDGSFYNLDRPWIRQYYLSDKNYMLPENCFDGIFRFYVPWVLDCRIKVSIKKPPVESPFLIYEDEIYFNIIPNNTSMIEPPFVHFHFKKEGSHMIDPGFAKIKRQSAMYDIEFETDDIMIIDKIKEFYDQHN